MVAVLAYTHRRRHGGDGNHPSDDITDSEGEEEEELGSADEMECDGDCDEGFCDGMGAAGYSADHTHTMEVWKTVH
jgi:hypothetical protein